MKSESRSFYECVTPLYYVSKFAGLWPQTLRKSSPGITLWNLAYNFSILFLYIYIFYENIHLELYEKFLDITKSAIFMYLTKLQVLANLLLGFINVTLAMIHYRILWKILDRFDDINSVLEKNFGAIFNYAGVKRVNYITVIINHSILVILLIISWFYYEKVLNVSSYIMYISQYMGNLPTLSLFSQCILCNFFVKRRFTLINEYFSQMIMTERSQKDPTSVFNIEENLTTFQRDFPLKKGLKVKPTGFHEILRKTTMNTYFINLDTPTLIEKISILAKIHDSLCDCIELVNQIFSVPILLALCTMYIFNLIGYFSCYRAFFDGHQGTAIITAVTNALWIIYYLLIKLIIIYASHSMTREGKHTGVIIHRIINSTSEKILLTKLSTISDQILLSNPVFSCGLFSFDWTLMYTIVVSTTAYLAFLIQFDLP